MVKGLLDDGRRIGIDFWLYDRNHWLEHHTRIPLGRQELEKAIGAGGQVVHDQASYRDLVNRQLFGFADAESYQDLLHLMEQALEDRSFRSRAVATGPGFAAENYSWTKVTDRLVEVLSGR